MASSLTEYKLSSGAVGFTICIGVSCMWEAFQQTKAVHSPRRSIYLYMVWGEILSNIGFAVLGFLFLDGFLKTSVPVLFGLLAFWVFEVQLLLQIIINRIQVVHDDQIFVFKLRWGTALITTIINIAVFVIWIPSHVEPVAIPILVIVNKYWDRVSKLLILLIDAALNYTFLRTVKITLVKQHGLRKYAPLVSFNAKLMACSVGLDLLLIILESVPSKFVYLQFHPVVYLIKLKIELSMANLITKIARGTANGELNNVLGSRNMSRSHHCTCYEQPIVIKTQKSVYPALKGKDIDGQEELIDRSTASSGPICGAEVWSLEKGASVRHQEVVVREVAHTKDV